MKELLKNNYFKSLLGITLFVFLVPVMCVFHKVFIMLVGETYSLTSGWGLIIGWLAGFIFMIIFANRD
jgi:hypothetical protein